HLLSSPAVATTLPTPLHTSQRQRERERRTTTKQANSHASDGDGIYLRPPSRISNLGSRNPDHAASAAGGAVDPVRRLASRIGAKRLYEDLLGNYNRLIRPVGNNTDKLTVKLGLRLSQLIDVDEKNQIMTTNVWIRQINDASGRESAADVPGAATLLTGDNMRFEDESKTSREWYDYKSWRWEANAIMGGVNLLYVPSSSIWLPDIVLYNNADGHYQRTSMFYPFDEQTWRNGIAADVDVRNGFQVDLIHRDDDNGRFVDKEYGIDLQEFYPSVEWDVLAVPATRHERYYPCCPEPFPDITYYVQMRRKTLFYTVNLIIPCVSISFLTVLVFYLPSDSGEKVTLCISILLSLTVFFLLLSEIIPPTSIVIPLIGKYLLFTLILVTLSICVTVYVLNVHFRTPATHTMSPWVKRVFLNILPRLLFIRRPIDERNRQPTTKTSFRACNGLDFREMKRISPSSSLGSPRFIRISQSERDQSKADSRRFKPYPDDVVRAMRGIQYIAEHLQDEDDLRQEKFWSMARRRTKTACCESAFHVSAV
ncbi:PREDICTED: LOW QUALITY PROTEIN: acetylcholine receptor subunit alpha-like, partial [Priapulus caudatus]|uniref:LOW QUALITY PROTEIN: acetylcholine receptor subunit alpha-like n=1 Tax=Priapulus caudatus TaxID=37621 RepID=A0ABM1F9F4_PRICU